MMFFRLFSTVSLLIIFLFFAYRAHAAHTNVTIIKIGVLLEETGSWDEGIRVREVVKMAIDDINNSTIFPPNYRMDVIVADDGSAPLPSIKATLAVYDEAQKSGIPLSGLLLGGISVACQPAAQIGAVWELPQVSWGCSSPSLSNKANFPYFTRTYPSETLQAVPIIGLIRFYGWSRIAIIQQQEDIFVLQNRAIVELCGKHHIDIVAAESFATGSTFSSQLNNIKNSNARIIVFATYGDTARDIFILAKQMGMMAPGYVWIGNGWYGDSFYQGSTLASDEVSGEASMNVIGVQGDLGSGPTYDALNAKFIAQYETPKLRSLGFTGIGWGSLAYDGLFALAHAYAGALKSNESIQGGPAVLRHLLLSNFTGVSGRVAFDKNGDRIAPYSVMNFRKAADGKLRWIEIGHYSEENGLNLKQQVHFAGGQTSIPSDRPPIEPIRIFTAANVIRILVYVLSGLVTGFLLIVAIVLTKARNTVMVRAASFPQSVFILASLVIMSIGSIFFVLDPASTPFVCQARPWFTCMSLTAVLSALAAKTNRIRLIFNSNNLAQHVQSNRDLFLIIGVLLSLQVALLIGSSASNLSVAELVVGTKSTSGTLVHQCSSITYSDNGIEKTSSAFIAWFVIQVAYQGVFLVGVTYIAWTIRNVPTTFNEASRLLACSFILCVYCFLLLPLNFLIDDNPNALMVIRGVGQNLGALTLGFAVFGPCLIAIYSGRANDMQAAGSSVGRRGTKLGSGMNPHRKNSQTSVADSSIRDNNNTVSGGSPPLSSAKAEVQKNTATQLGARKLSAQRSSIVDSKISPTTNLNLHLAQNQHNINHAITPRTHHPSSSISMIPTMHPEADVSDIHVHISSRPAARNSI